LDKRLLIGNAEGFNPCDGRVGHGKRDPLVTGDAGASGEGQKVVVALCVSSRIEGNGSQGPCFGGVGRVVVLEHLDVSPEFEFDVVIVRVRASRDKGLRTEVVGDAVAPGKLV
jgi:hypothetical protein